MKKSILYTLISLSLFCFDSLSQTNIPRFRIKGKIVDETTNKPTGVFPVKIIEFNRTINTNEQGEFLFNMPQGTYTFEFDDFPYFKKELKIELVSDTTLLIKMKSPEGTHRLEEVKVTANKVFTDKLTGITKINSSDLNGLPTMIGERDILKVLSLNAGVTSSGEGAADMQVRGGLHGQNLFLLDKIPLYSTQHMFGMVSVYNPVIIKSAELYKSGFPSEFGGRISSVVDVRTKDPNLSKFTGETELSLFTTKASLNIPIIKNKVGVTLAGRISNYSILNILSLANLLGETQTGLHFADLNATISYKPTDKDDVKLSYFYNSDGFSVTQNEDVSIYKSWQNNKQQYITFNWNRIISQNTENTIQLYTDGYLYDFGTESKLRKAAISDFYNISNNIKSIGFEDKIDLKVSDYIKINTGVALKSFVFSPLRINTSDSILENDSADIKQREGNLYFQTKYQINKNHSLDAGLRLSAFGNSEKAYFSLEPRLSYLGKLSDDFSINATVSKMAQNIHRVANMGIGMPLELFYASDQNLLPEKSWIYSLGAAKDFKIDKEQISIKTDFWLKQMWNIVEFKDGYDAISILLSDNVNTGNNSTYLTQGDGIAYGMDLSGSYNTSKLNFSVDYTLMKVMSHFNDLNNGNWFAASTDIRHSLSLVTEIKLKKNWSFSAVWQYRSGRPVTLPTAIFPVSEIDYNSGSIIFPGGLSVYNQAFQMIENERNNVRLRSFHKLDISFNHTYLIKKKYQSMISFGLYNAYNRANPAYYFIDQKKINGTYYPVLKSISLFPILPSFNWSIKF